MKTIFYILAIIFPLVSAMAQDQNITVTPLQIGDRVQLHSKVLSEERILNIYLPHGYSPDSVKTYPVIYLLDGSIDEDFIHIAGIVQFGSYPWINMVPESIVVGVSNVDRKRDFTYPTTNRELKEEFPTTGGSEHFISFIESELQPYVNRHYKVDGTSRTIIGQSLGGLVATEILFKKPDLFDHYIIVSPSLWWDDESLLQYTPVNYTSNKSVFVGVGKEGEIMERVARQLHKKVEASDSKTKLYFQYFEESDHADVLHIAVYRAFQHMFWKKESHEPGH